MTSRREFLTTLMASGAFRTFGAGAAAPDSAELDPQLNPDGFLEVGDEIHLPLAHAAFLNGEAIPSFATVTVTDIYRDFTRGVEFVSVTGGLLPPMTLRLPLLG